MKLIERDGPLLDLYNAQTAAAAGSGRTVLISGEAGIGKSALVEHFVCEQPASWRRLWGACDDFFTPRPLGPLHDVAGQVQGELARLLRGELDRAAIFSACLNELQTPTLLVLEDIHWADEATLDLLKFLGRRMARTPSLLIATYRDDELDARHPLRLLLGDLVMSAATCCLSLPPLSLDGVRTLAGARALDVAALHQQTGGNPFFITEVLAAESGNIPTTIREAVLARAARLSLSGRVVLNAAAVIGPRIESWLLVEVTRAEAGAVAESLALGILHVQDNVFTFRHELSRQVILDSILPHQRTFLHQAVLDALKASPTAQQDVTRLAHHAEAADNHQAVLEFAPAAAAAAAAANAHREAAALYALAIRFAEALPLDGRALLLEAYAQQCDHVGQQAEGVAARRRALALWRELGNPLKQGENLANMMNMLVRLGQNAEAQQVSQAAVEILETVAPGPELALAYRVRASIALVNRDYEEALAWAEKARALAERFEDAAVLSYVHITIGTARMFLEYKSGCAYLESKLSFAHEAGLDARVAHIYTNLGSGSGELYHLRRAERYLADGIAHATAHDLDSFRLYMLAWQGVVSFYRGRWHAAADLSTRVLQSLGVTVISRITALTTLGRLHTRRGEPAAQAALDEALALATQTDTIHRLAPVRAARAEAAWLAGNHSCTLTEGRAVYDLAASKQHPWFTGELAFWRWQAGESVSLPAWTAFPFAQHMAGDWRAAAAAWEAVGCPYEQARALTDGDTDAQLDALAMFEQLGARPMVNIVRERLRNASVRTIPRGPRPTTKENPFRLTNRQVEILTLLTEHLTNAEIAARLHISPKTVDHHVSAVLAKLDVPSREDAADLARQHASF